MTEELSMKPRSVLLACPDDPASKSLSAFLRDLGYRVGTASILSEILQRVQRENVEVVVLNEEIEGVKASELIPLLKTNRKVQVIVISSEESLGFAKRLRGAGIFYHAMKPIDFEEVRSAVESALEKIRRESLEEDGIPLLRPGWVPA
jgi:DNA-binding NtrC family response regulator